MIIFGQPTNPFEHSNFFEVSRQRLHEGIKYFIDGLNKPDASHDFFREAEKYVDTFSDCLVNAWQDSKITDEQRTILFTQLYSFKDSLELIAPKFRKKQANENARFASSLRRAYVRNGGIAFQKAHRRTNAKATGMAARSLDREVSAMRREIGENKHNGSSYTRSIRGSSSATGSQA